MSARVADWRLKMGFGGGIGAPFRFGKSTFAGTDVFAKAFAEFFTGPYDDITDDIADNSTVSWTRGLDAKLQAIESGQMRFTVLRHDDISFYDPNNPDSPLFTEDPGFVPMRPVQLQAIADGEASSPLTVSGNEITDATRALGIDGDGLQNDGSFGIFKATTNLSPYSGTLSAVVGFNGGVVVADSTHVLFAGVPGDHLKLTTPGVTIGGGGEGLSCQPAARGAAVNGQTYTCSYWVYSAAGGEMVSVGIDQFNAAGAYLSSLAGARYTLNPGWNRLTVTGTTNQATIAKIGPTLRTVTAPQAITVWVVGQQTEAGILATPLQRTTGAVATRPAARVPAPSTLLRAGNFGWVLRIRPGFSATDDVYGGGAAGGCVAYWGTPSGATGYYQLFFREGDNSWHLRIGDSVSSRSEAIKASTHIAGDEITIAAQVVGDVPYISINGSPFTTSGGTPWPITPPQTIFDIGSLLGAAQFNGEVLWAATFEGTLTDADAAWLDGELQAGREPFPADVNDRAPLAVCTATMSFTDASYLIPGQTYGEFYGFVRDAQYDPETGRCDVTAEDLFLWMSRVDNPVISTMTGVSSADVVGALLDSFDFSDPTLRNITTLPSVTGITFTGDGTKGTLDHLKDMLDVEQGRSYVDRDGAFNFEDRYARDRRRTVTRSFDTELYDVSSRASADDIGNRVTVTPATGTAAVVEDMASRILFGVGDIATVTTDYLDTDAKAQSLAALVLKRRKDPHPPQYGTVHNETGSVLLDQLQIELQEHISVQGTEGFVERLEHVLAAGGIDLQTTFYITETAPESAFQFGYSKFVAAGDTTGDYIAA